VSASWITGFEVKARYLAIEGDPRKVLAHL